jgi:hypothetical protein
MIKNLFKVTALLCLFSLSACDNAMTKSFGGTMTVELEKDQKLVNASWKSSGKSSSSLWLLTRVRKDNEQPETYKYIEKSTYGVFEGTVVIQEK